MTIGVFRGTKKSYDYTPELRNSYTWKTYLEGEGVSEGTKPVNAKNQDALSNGSDTDGHLKYYPHWP